MDDPNIWKMDFAMFRELANILHDEDTMDTFLEALPSKYSHPAFLREIKIEGQKIGSTPAKALLLRLGSEGKCVSHLIRWCETAGLINALMVLKDDEPIRIINNTPARLHVNEGSTICIIFEATCFPFPEYQWLFGDEELLRQQRSQLLIPKARVKDSGIYKCRVRRICRVTKEYTDVFSEATQVDVIPSDVPVESFEDNVDTNLHSVVSKKIEVIKQPFLSGKITPGTSIILTFEVTNSGTCHFQWFCDEEILEGAMSSDLVLKNIFQDPVTQQKKWKYQCVVHNGYDTKVSHVVEVELEDWNPSQPCYEEKIAFLVANDTYVNLPKLLKPANDVVDLAAPLSSLGFKVLTFLNLNYAEMKNAFHLLCSILKPNSYVVFYFAGHGFECGKQVFLQPVDCSATFRPQEAFCTQQLLERLQQTKPALNLLLIDSCRKQPSYLREAAPHPFGGQMRGNTVYCYATCSSEASHENDLEWNGYFMKYLKQYIMDDEPIEIALKKVKADFQLYPATRNLQFPEVQSTLGPYRKLCDPVRAAIDSSRFDALFHWADIKKKHIYQNVITLSKTSYLLLEYEHHRRTFCNGIDLRAYLDVKNDATLQVFSHIQMELKFGSPGLEIKTTERSCDPLQLGAKNLLFKMHIIGLQKVEGQLSGNVLLRAPEIGVVQELPFSLTNIKIGEYQLSINRFDLNEQRTNSQKS